MKLETERLLLRLPEAGDADGYLEVFSDPKVVAFLGMTPQTREDNVRGIERMRLHWERYGIGLFSVVRKEDERLLGRVGFLMWDPERWVSAMREEAWRATGSSWRSAGRSAASTGAAATRPRPRSPAATGRSASSGYTRLISLIAHGNTGSIRVAEKIGEAYEREDLPGPFDCRVDLYSLGNGPAR